jgi:ribose 5-phosphate isomerase B
MEISIGCDHAGFDLKEQVKQLLEEFCHKVNDEGTFSDESTDYPDFAKRVSQAVSKGTADRGILICGTGIGMSIVANKFEGVRAALCHNVETAQMSRLHNDSNVLALGSRVLDQEVALNIVREWLQTNFSGGRHQKRLDKIKGLGG